MFAGQNVQYDRKIRYLDYYENGQRCQGAGFIKLERRDELCNISLQISGLYRRDRFTRPFMLLGENGEKELCKLQIAEGGIKIYFEGLNSRDLGGQGISYGRLLGVRVPIADGKEIRCVWRRMPEKEGLPGAGTTQEGLPGAESAQVAWQGDMPEAGTAQESLPGAESAQEDMAEAGMAQGTLPESAQAVLTETGATLKARQANPFKEEKWDQLWMIYPHVHPFSDEREFLSVSPSDFVLLGRQSYKLVNNSFLLHGYYSFRHLILMRGEKRGQITFYIGVPGNLYERDKKSAVMFGFESFECANEPAQEGDFGYYLIPVDL